MITVFRKIRAKLLKQNKFTNYLLYAAGEILLVIFGILIALNINNRNEAAKELQKVDNILLQVAGNLEREIGEATDFLDFGLRKDSLIGIILNKKLTRDDIIADDGGYSDVAMALNGVNTIFANRNYYDVLNQNKNGVPAEYADMMNTLDILYNQIHQRLLKVEGGFIEESKRIIQYRSDTYAWYHNRTFDEASLDFYLRDFRFKNQAEDFRLNGLGDGGVLAHTMFYRIVASVAYLKIYKALDKELEQKDFVLDTAFTKNFLGEYRLEHPIYDRLEVNMRNGSYPMMKFRLMEKGGDYVPISRGELHTLSKAEYYSESGVFRHFRFLPDSTGKPIRIRLKQAEKEYIAVKIEREEGLNGSKK